MWIWSIDVSGAEAADASTPAKSIVVIDSIVVIIFCAFICRNEGSNVCFVDSFLVSFDLLFDYYYYFRFLCAISSNRRQPSPERHTLALVHTKYRDKSRTTLFQQYLSVFKSIIYFFLINSFDFVVMCNIKAFIRFAEKLLNVFYVNKFFIYYIIFTLIPVRMCVIIWVLRCQG